MNGDQVCFIKHKHREDECLWKVLKLAVTSQTDNKKN